MLQKLFTTLSILIASIGFVNAQNEAAIKVRLVDKTTRETIPFANVLVEMGGIQAGVGTTNIDGEVTIKPLNPGRYNVKSSYVGYQPSVINNVIVSVGKTVQLNMEMVAGTELEVVEIVEYSVPLIDPDTKSGATITREEYQNMASKNINSVAATTAGIYQADEGGALSVRGARSDATAYYVDGQKVIGSAGVPQAGVEQVTTIIGGTPAEYGDNTGGIISITTRGPASRYNGGIELITSGLGEKNGNSRGLDAYGYNFVGFSVSGPILTKKDTLSQVKKSVLGFSVSGEAVTVQDGDPSAVGFYRIKPDVLANLEQNPLRPSAQGSGFVLNSEFVTANDMERIKARQNVRSNSLRLNGKIVYQPTTNMTITAGGSVDYGKSHDFIYEYALFNPSNNSQTTQNTWRAYAKLTQKFNSSTPGEEEKNSSVIKNAYFTLQAGFEKTSTRTEDDDHKLRAFDYGYIGKFEQTKINSYSFEKRDKYDIDGDGVKDTIQAFFHDGFQDVNLSFSPGTLNPNGVAYTNQFYSLNDPLNINNFNDVQAGLGLMNGDRPQNIYALWYNTGRQYGGYNFSEATQFRVFGNFSADIKKHAVQIGFEYEQRNQRAYNISAISAQGGLWGLMRQITNSHIQNLDDTPTLNTALSAASPYDYYDFNRKNDGTQKQFDRSLREALGLNPDGVDWIDVDALDPSQLSLDMFSADDLLNLSGTPLVGYNGYDHTGKKTKGNTSLDDFYTKKDAKGNFTRAIGSYQPIYIAGYIQDKFDFKDLKFNVGLRIDRFDANQKVLKDKYLLFDAKTAGEVDYDAFGATRPSNIGDDFVVYVDDKDNPTSISGYRDQYTWYNAQGVEVSDPAASIPGSGTRPNPYLLDPQNKTISSSVFKDFDPQINFMPRIAFAFPISDVANFFAHYDVLTQRPPSGNRLDPYDYLAIQNNTASSANNPNLKPQRTTDYELGFTQVLNEKKNSAITLTTFYRELRNMVQVVSINQAYPQTYTSFDNVDFGTVKGFSFAYDLRRTAGVRLTASYTLQFADGTGSSATDGVNLISAGVPNLRTTHPLDFDQRHTVVLNVDYRFGAGKDYRGPAFTAKKGSDNEKIINILEDVGANVVLRAGSGTPYSKQSNISQDAAFGIAQRRTLSGDINGSNLPWNFKIDLRVDKNISLKWGGNKEGAEKKTAELNVYLQVLNVLNTQNVLAVYRATGNPNDDGYIASKDGQNSLANRTDATSFTDLYGVKINNPNNYSRPRVIRLGLLLNF